MKLTQRQLRGLVTQALSEAMKPKHTGGKNHATGFGLPKDRDVRFEHELANIVAGHLDVALDELIRSNVDVDAVATAADKELNEELESNPHLADVVLGLDQASLVATVIKVYKADYGLDQVLGDVVEDIVRQLLTSQGH